MPANILAYSGIVTKAKAMGSKLISLENYTRISQLETTADFISFLKSQPGYADIYGDFDERTLHRGQIEHFLMNALYTEYAKLFRFANPKQQHALSFVSFRYEVTILKSCLQCMFSQEEAYDLTLFLPFFDKYSKLKISELVGAKTMEEFISLLKGTEYHPLFLRMYDTDHLTLHDYEVQLDIYYFTRIWKSKDKHLKGSERDALTRTLGYQIDLLNIMWIYRSKKFYAVDTAKIYASIIPIHYKLSTAQLTKLVESANLDEFMTVLRTTYYEDIYSEETEQFSMELAYRKRINKVFQENKQKFPASMAPIYSFLHLKEQEIDRLTTALECIRYKLDPNETLSFVLK